ncbi:hypothetical protein C7212DRAFT_280489 [Tuber magnatum]|uniref:Uncharacterized protein n=1 Tax=Tuber magnatum TaxID=42249 RepID=A0A317SNP4_9PEZI|nr:hypothetical protein C7212DRAFT_280489 [Tuber magnatum]
MPVTIKPSPEIVGRNADPTVHSVEGLLKRASEAWSPASESFNRYTRERDQPENRRVIQSSFHELNSRTPPIIPYGNGLVNGVIRAFQQDLHLVLRPDDIWLSILTQFSMFVNGNAEHLRTQFVSHQGKKPLVVDIRPYPIHNIDMGKFAQVMTVLIQENVVDPQLRGLIMPNFTTTTEEDKSVAAIVMMGTLQRYFKYSLRGGCGFPSVTLLGEVSDWEEILRKVQCLPQYGPQTSEWARLLTPVIQYMIASFTQPTSPDIKNFWLRACHAAGQDGSNNMCTLSGWITAFCFFNETGLQTRGYSDEQLGTYATVTSIAERKRLVLGDIVYPIMPISRIPKGVVSVPVTIEDYATGLEHTTTMVAGSVGMTASATNGGKDLTTVQPRSGWWILEDSVKRMDDNDFTYFNTSEFY